MDTTRFPDSPDNFARNYFGAHLAPARTAFTRYPLRYAVTTAAGVALLLALNIFGVGGVNWPLTAVAMSLLLGGVGAHAVVMANVLTARQESHGFGLRLSAEASASRVLSGIKLLATAEYQGGSERSQSRLAAAARMATGFPAAVVFSLNDAHGVFMPTTEGSHDGSPEGQLNLRTDDFEAVDGQTPGAIAARSSSAVVMSLADRQNVGLPAWAEQAGFVQGIVAPIVRGLDTVGVVYVFSKSTDLPTLAEIEQLELVVSFESNFPQQFGPSFADRGAQAGSLPSDQPFRTLNSRSDRQVASQASIRMPGFLLNHELERMELDGVSLPLSPTEFLLVNTLASSPGRPVAADALVNTCWAPDARPADNGLDVAIFRLRRKLSKTASGKGLIKTVRGSGYMFVPPATETALPATVDLVEV